MNIYVDTLQLIEKSNEIKMINAELANVMQRIEQTLLFSRGEWQGVAGSAFFENILDAKKQFENIESFFNDYADMLRGFAFEYEQQEHNLISKINLA